MRSSAWDGENAAGSSKGYRNGHYTRDLATSTGRIEDLKVPRDREGQFHTQAFERYSRYEPHIAEGLTQMFVSGTSTRHPWGKSPKRCWESLEVASTISRLNQTLTQQFEAWRERLRPRALADCVRRTLVHFSIRHGDQCDSTIILTA
jgi:putative transposase